MVARVSSLLLGEGAEQVRGFGPDATDKELETRVSSSFTSGLGWRFWVFWSKV